VCLALGDLAVVAGAPVAVPVADLGDGGHMDGVAGAPVAAQRQPIGDAPPKDTSMGAVPV
jgi:hypothetical protein